MTWKGNTIAKTNNYILKRGGCNTTLTTSFLSKVRVGKMESRNGKRES